MKPRISEAVYAAYADERHAAEVRYIMAMPSGEERGAYMDRVEEKRGKAAADRLRADVKAEVLRRREAAAAAARAIRQQFD